MPRRPHPWIALLAAATLLPAGIAGCAAPDARTGAAAAQPLAPPGRASTPYTHALACLNQQLRVREITLTQPQRTRLGAGTMPDATGKVSPGLRDMVTHAMFEATHDTNVFITAEALSLAALPGGVSGPGLPPPGALITPQPMPNDPSALQVYGALTQADRDVQGEDVKAGIGTTKDVFGISKNADIANVGLDLHLARVDSGVLLQSVANQMTVRNISRGANADFNIDGVGLSFEYSFSEREGVHQAVRTLVELTVLELLGRAAQVPYWQCLHLNRGNPQVLKQIAEWYRGMDAAELDSFVRARMRTLGYNVPNAPGSMAAVLSLFQTDQNLAPSGQPTFETFAALVDDQLAAAAPGPLPDKLPPPAPSGPRRIRLNVTELAIAEPLLQLSIQPDRASRVVCYYRDDEGATWRLLPNRHQPEQQVAADAPLLVPGHLLGPPVVQPHRMTPDVGFLCAAGERDWSTALPAEMWGTDLQRLPGVTFAGLRETLARVGGPDVGVVETTDGHNAGLWTRIEQLPQ